MNQLVPVRQPDAPALPALVAAAGDHAGVRFLEFFMLRFRRDYARAAAGFLA